MNRILIIETKIAKKYIAIRFSSKTCDRHFVQFSYLRSPCLLIDLIVPSSWYTPSPSNSILIILSPGTRDAKSAPWIPELKQLILE